MPDFFGDGFPQVVIFSSRSAVQRHEDPGHRLDRPDSLDVQSLFGLPRNHCLKHSMHVANGWSQRIDARLFHELFRLSWGRETFL